MEDWYRVSTIEIAKYGGSTALLRYGGLYNILKEVYPQVEWETNRFTSPLRYGKAQWVLFKIVKEFASSNLLLLPTNSTTTTTSTTMNNTNNNNMDEILVEYLHPDLIYQDTLQKMELDIYIPSLSLAFEYQGEHHYKHHFIFGDPEPYKIRYLYILYIPYICV